MEYYYLRWIQDRQSVRAEFFLYWICQPGSEVSKVATFIGVWREKLGATVVLACASTGKFHDRINIAVVAARFTDNEAIKYLLVFTLNKLYNYVMRNRLTDIFSCDYALLSSRRVKAGSSICASNDD